MNNKKLGFTLAEVLITLGIIGVVAALTMPMLMQKYNNSVAETRLKKFYSTMNQAIMMAKNNYGDFPWNDYAIWAKRDEDGEYIDQNDKSDIVYNKYFAPYLNIIDNKKVIDAENYNRILHYFSDGSAFAFRPFQNQDIEFFPSHAEKCIKFKVRERIGTCSFFFAFIADDKLLPEWKYHYKKGVEPYLYAWDGQVSTLYKGCNNELINYQVGYCTSVISQNGWKIPKDYPRKIKF